MTARFTLLGFVALAIQCVSNAFSPAPSLNFLCPSRIVAHKRCSRVGIGVLSMKTETISRERKQEILSNPVSVAVPTTPQPMYAEGESQILGYHTAHQPLVCGKHSIMGLGTSHINQDDASFIQNVDSASVMAVFDGHGYVGCNVAKHLSRTMPKILLQKVQDAGGLDTNVNAINKCFKEAFAAVEKDLFDQGIAEESSGATATVALVQGKDLVVGWLGDSRAVIGGHTQGGIGQTSAFPYGIKGGVHVDRLTRDHVPSNKLEKLRVLSCGGEVQHKNLRKNIEADYVYYRGKDFPGLSVTRSFGDLYGKMGSRHLISSEPELVTRKLRESDEVMVMASDGVWEFVSDAEAIQGALRFIDGRDAAEAAKFITSLVHPSPLSSPASALSSFSPLT